MVEIPNDKNNTALQICYSIIIILLCITLSLIAYTADKVYHAHCYCHSKKRTEGTNHNDFS